MTNQKSGRLLPGKDTVVVRMYRQGLGDAYLLAFHRKRNPYYVLIDCGVHARQDEGAERLRQVMEDIQQATQGHLDLLVITHEHTDHLSGFIQRGSPFVNDGLTIGDVWFGWVEKPNDEQARHLERNRQDQKALLARLQQRISSAKQQRLQMSLHNTTPAPETAHESASRLDVDSVENSPIAILEKTIRNYQDFNNFIDSETLTDSEIVKQLHSVRGREPELSDQDIQRELSGDSHNRHLKAYQQWAPSQPMLSAGEKTRRVSSTKLALALIKHKTQGEVHYLEPGEVRSLDEMDSARAFVLGPPRDENLLKRDRPRKLRGTQTHQETYVGLGSTSLDSLPMDHAAYSDAITENMTHPFSVDIFTAKTLEQLHVACKEKTTGDATLTPIERVFDRYVPLVHGNRDFNHWRTIGEDWLADASTVALSMDSDTNNTSLVLAFELGKPGQGEVLLFAADAQVGNWLSWRDQPYAKGNRTTIVDDLLKRTVLYKVGHHGSHNATLRRDPRANNGEGDDYGLELMNDIIAMINVDKKAVEKKWHVPWAMPYRPLYDRLREKASLRILRSDCEISPLPAGSTPDVVPTTARFSPIPGRHGWRWRRAKQEQRFRKGNDIHLFYDIEIPYNN